MSPGASPGPITPLPLETLVEPRRQRRRRRERSSPDPERESARVRMRHIRGWLIALAIGGIAVVPIKMWSGYSSAFVTSRNATVKGSITHVGSQIDGVLASVEVEAGQRVEPGQVLARFGDSQLQASILRYESRVREAKARSASAWTRIEAAQTQAIEARVRYEQRLPLAKSGAISRDEMRTAETRLQTAEAMERTSIADHDASGAEVSTAEAELALARANLGATVIRAPAEGRVLRRISEPGTSVVVGQPVIDLLIGSEVWVEAWIDQANLSKVAVGNDVKVTVTSAPGREFLGKVESIGVSTDYEMPEAAVPQSRRERMRMTPVVPVRVRLAEYEGLLPGLSATVAIQRTDAKGTDRADTRRTGAKAATKGAGVR